LRQRTLFEYGLPTEGPKHEQGLPKERAEFANPILHNVPWGDPIVSADEVLVTGIFRLVLHNVNGLSLANNHVDVVHMANAMADKQVALFGIQETNRNFERQSMVNSFHRVIQSTCTHHHGVIALAKLQWPQNYQPGGTAILVRNKWATRFLKKGGDVYNQWSWLTLASRGTMKITCISAYRVCDGAQEASITSRTVRAQQEWMYADRGYSSVNLRDQFVRDIIATINDFQTVGHKVILMMVCNEASGFGTAVDRILYACNMADVHALDSKTDPPATYHRGSEKIDFILISASLVTAVRTASIMALHDGYLSDHRALLVDFDANSLFSGDTSQVTPAVERR
jgi:exonuclease III